MLLSRICPVIMCALTEIAHAADKIGLKLSAKACFNPTAAPECVMSHLDLFVPHSWHRTGCLSASVRLRNPLVG